MTKVSKKSAMKKLASVKGEVAKATAAAEKEIAKLRKQAESAAKKADQYVKKNPEKAALIAAGIGAAIASAATAFIAGQSKKKKRK